MAGSRRFWWQHTAPQPCWRDAWGNGDEKGESTGKGRGMRGGSEETALWGGGRELQASGQGLPPQETWWGRCALVHAWERVLILPLFLTILIYFDWQ